jgi:hypothetical protein
LQYADKDEYSDIVAKATGEIRLAGNILIHSKNPNPAPTIFTSDARFGSVAGSPDQIGREAARDLSKVKG